VRPKTMDLQRDGAALSIARISKIVAYVYGRYQLDPPKQGTPYEPSCGSSASQKTVRSYALRCISALRANTVVPLLFDLANATVCADRTKASVFLEKESHICYFCLALGQGQNPSDKLNVRVPNVRGQPCITRLNRGDGSPCFLSR
jgi:hypothetical protein